MSARIFRGGKSYYILDDKLGRETDYMNLPELI